MNECANKGAILLRKLVQIWYRYKNKDAGTKMHKCLVGK